ncbi:hypothetical protein CSC02_2604 [Enterobacter hormaechei subsp. hoffmannii]|nr:hypothetical protein CSC02_2604 [Enterobacter hormaechei subsp. hoffmannii]
MLNPTAHQNFNNFITFFQYFITKIVLNVQYFFLCPYCAGNFLYKVHTATS